MNADPNSADALLIQGTCAVLVDGHVKGTAWLISSDGHLLTAGHLLGKQHPLSEVEIRFSDDVPQKAFRLHWEFQQEVGVDFAVLKCVAPPTARTPIPWKLESFVSGSCRLHGYGKTMVDRSGGVGEFLTPVELQNSSSNRLFQLRSPELGEQGYSGGAVFSDELNAVVAIQIEATAASTGPHRDSILAMPLYRIAQRWERLKEIVENVDRPENGDRPDRVRIGRLPTQHAAVFVDRDHGLAFLDGAWANPKTNVAVIRAFGGVGKTALVQYWLNQITPSYGGARLVFAHSFYAQGQGYDTQVSSDAFLNAALRFFRDSNPEQGSPLEKGERLAELVREQRTLLILDGIEPLLSPDSCAGGKIRDPGLAQLVRDLAGQNNGLCVITTRLKIRDIEIWNPPTVEVNELEYLPPEAGARLLAELGVQGTDNELKSAAKQVKGHALTLTLLGNYLQDAHGGDIRHLSMVDFSDFDEERPAREIMRTYQDWIGERREWSILRLLGLFDRPAAKEDLAELIADPAIPGLTDELVGLSPEDWNNGVSKLRKWGLLSESAPWDRHRSELDTHPLIREYFSDQLSKDFAEAGCEGHARLYKHLRQRVAKEPETVEEVILLCRAVRHACRGGLVKESFDDLMKARIFRQGAEFLYGRSGVAPSLIPGLREYFQDSFTGPLKVNDPRDQIMLFLFTGHCLASAGGFPTEPVPRIFERFYEFCDKLKLPEPTFQALIGLLYCNIYSCDLVSALDVVEKMEAIANSDEQPELTVTARQARAEVELYMGRVSDGYDTADSHLTSATPENASVIPFYDPWVAFLGYRAWGHLNLGRPQQAIEDAATAIDRAIKLAESPSTLTVCHTSGLAWFNFAVVHFENGDVSDLRTAVTALRELAKKREFSFWTSLTQIMDGAAHLLEGGWEDGIKKLNFGITKWKMIGNERALTRYYCLLAQVQLAAKEFDGAARSLASAFFRQHDGEQFYLAELHRVRAELMRRRDPDRTADVDSEYRKALHVADGQQGWMLKVRAALGYHDFTQEHGGDVDEAIRILDDAYQRCDPSYMTRDFRAAEQILNR